MMNMSERIVLISNSRKEFLKLLLKDPRIAEETLINGDASSSIRVNDDGSVTYGLTPVRWWNFLFRAHRTEKFPMVAFSVRRALAKYTPEYSQFQEVMKDEIVDNAIDSLRYDAVVDRLFLNSLLGVNEGEYRLKILGNDPHDPKQKRSGNINYKYAGKTTVGINIGGECIPVELVLQER